MTQSHVMQWLYISDRDEQTVTNESELSALVNQGSIRAHTLVWNSHLADWTEASIALPNLFSPPSFIGATASLSPIAPIGQRALPESKPTIDAAYRELGKILEKASGWLQFLGVIYALNFITILPIFLAIKCFTISSNAKAASRSGDYPSLKKAISEVKDLFILQGAFALLIMLFYVLIFFITLLDS